MIFYLKSEHTHVSVSLIKEKSFSKEQTPSADNNYTLHIIPYTHAPMEKSITYLMKNRYISRTAGTNKLVLY